MRNQLSAEGVVVEITGEIVNNAVLSAEDMCSMNFARDEFDKLYAILWPLVRSGKNEATADIARHLEQVRIFSSNFCWSHRHLGASHGLVGKRPSTDFPEA